MPQAGSLGIAFLIAWTAILLYLHQLVEAKGHSKAHTYHYIQLHINRCTQLPRCPPYQHHHRINHKNKQGGTKITESHVNKQMVQVSLVGTERRLATHVIVHALSSSIRGCLLEDVGDVDGTALGYASAELTWYLNDKLLGTGSNIVFGCSGNTVDVKYNF